MLARHGVWTPLGVWRLVSYAIGADQSITATFAFTIHSYSYQNRLYPIWIWFEVLSAGGTLLTGGGTPPDIPPNPPGGAGGDATGDGFVVGGQMGNLVVSDSSGHPDNDYVCLDPDGAPPLQSSQVTFEIEDLGDPHEYRWTVFFSSTGIEGDWQASVSGTAEEPEDVTATWDGTDAVGNPMPWGVYTFDVFVQEVADCSIPEAPAIDSAWLKGPYRLTLGDHSFDLVEQEDGTTDAVVSYTLNDTSGTPATEVLIDLVGPSLTSNTYYTATNVAAGEPSGELVIHTFPADEPPEAGIWRAVFCAEDGHGDAERDCENNRMLARNGPKSALRGMEVWYHWAYDDCSLHTCTLEWDAIETTFRDQVYVGYYAHPEPLDITTGALGGVADRRAEESVQVHAQHHDSHPARRCHVRPPVGGQNHQ